MARSRALLAALGGLAMGAVGVQAMSMPRSISQTKIVRQVEDVQDEYDYVIVGGGTAGLTVADRLTESGECKRLCIPNVTCAIDIVEANRDAAKTLFSLLNEDFLVSFSSLLLFPSYFLGLLAERLSPANDSSVNGVSGGAQAFSNSSLSFNFPSVPQVNLGNRTTGVVGGVMLGGSSGVNGMQVHRPQKADIDRWGSYFGPCSEWNWENLLPYFRKVRPLLHLRNSSFLFLSLVRAVIMIRLQADT